MAAATSAYGWVKSAAQRGLSASAKPASATAQPPTAGHDHTLVELKLQSGQGCMIPMVGSPLLHEAWCSWYNKHTEEWSLQCRHQT